MQPPSLERIAGRALMHAATRPRCGALLSPTTARIPANRVTYPPCWRSRSPENVRSRLSSSIRPSSSPVRRTVNSSGLVGIIDQRSAALIGPGGMGVP